jgi:hypothetical protein
LRIPDDNSFKIQFAADADAADADAADADAADADAAAAAAISC